MANAEDTLIDYAVGRGGDIAKWKSSKLSFVLGIDLYGENIMNPIDGACVRYLNECKKTSKLFYAVFMQGNTGLNIRNGKCFTSEKDKMVINALIGKGTKDATVLGSPDMTTCSILLFDVSIFNMFVNMDLYVLFGKFNASWIVFSFFGPFCGSFLPCSCGSFSFHRLLVLFLLLVLALLASFGSSQITT